MQLRRRGRNHRVKGTSDAKEGKGEEKNESTSSALSRTNFEPGSLDMSARQFLRDLDEVVRDEHELTHKGSISTPRVTENFPDVNGDVNTRHNVFECHFFYCCCCY